MTVGLYKITNIVNGKFYIGSSIDIQRRWRDGHISKLNCGNHDNLHLQRAWNKYGQTRFKFELYRICTPTNLLGEEQKELDCWVGNPMCYNMRKSATCPVAPGEHRTEEVKRKISDTQKGKPRWNKQQRKQMGVQRKGRKHSNETLKKFKNRPSSYQNISKAQSFNDGRIYSKTHGENISRSKIKKNKKWSNDELSKIRRGVRKSISEGRFRKNKVALSEHETIRSLYLSGKMNQRKLALKYEITPPSMAKLLKRIGVK